LVTIRIGWPRMALVRVAFLLLLLGLLSLLGSALYDSYVWAFIGLGLTFWGALLLSTKPTKHVRLELLTASASSLLANVEEMLSITASEGKGTYLPPRLLQDCESSLVFISARRNEALPKREEIERVKTPKTSNGLFLTPPGLALARLFEKEMDKSFAAFDISRLRNELPRLFEKLEISKNTNIGVEDDTVTVEVEDHIFKDLCEETGKLPRTHEAVGCPFSSAIACALAKAAGKPVIIEEEQIHNGVTKIRYRILEE